METPAINLNIKRQADSVLTLQEMMRGEIDERAREYVNRQETLYFSELLEGQSRSENDFELNDGRMVCLDSKGFEIDWLELHSNGVTYAKQRAAKDKNLIPYIEIAEAEKAEAKLQHYYINLGKPATILSYSLCGDDLLSDEALISLGRSPDKKRGFVRVSVFDGQGSMKVMARSIDGLDIEEVVNQYLQLGIALELNLNTAQILKNPVVLDYADYGLADRLAPIQGTDTFKFVCSQKDLINIHINGLETIADRYADIAQCAIHSENLRYDIVSSLKQRLEGRWHLYNNLGESIAIAGNSERAAGTEYYGCDTALASRSTANRLGYFNGTENKTECVTCGVCSKVVNLPKELHSKGYSHCVECRSTLSKKHGRLLTKEETDILLSRHLNKKVKQRESFTQWWKRLGEEIKYKQKLTNQQRKSNQ